MIIAALLITLFYCALISAFSIGFTKVRSYPVDDAIPTHSFSIVVPFRDEEAALPYLLQSLEQLDYPKNKFEVLLVNDASQDSSLVLIESYLAHAKIDLTLIDNDRKSLSPKKDAIQTALKIASYNRIVTTDADCIVPTSWLRAFNALINTCNAAFIVAPVTLTNTTSFLHQFQLLDVLSLQGAAIGGFGIGKPFLCNGANLCYSKEIFNAVQGFTGNDTIASGDDIFLLEKVLKMYPDQIHYLKSRKSVIKTRTQPTFNALLHQRIRWAAKSSRYKNTFSKLVALSVVAMNVLLVVLVAVSFLGYFPWLFLVIIFLLKLSFDALLLYKTATFFNQKKVMRRYIPASLLYPFFSMFVALASLFAGYQWKGRQFKR